MSRYPQSNDYGMKAYHNQQAQPIFREVWANNLEEEIKNLIEALEDYKFVAMDTEFPGIVAEPIGTFRSRNDHYYQSLRCNVDLLNIIQLGVTLFDDKGDPNMRGPCTWQFNFVFNLQEDMYAQSSIELLKTAGIDFHTLSQKGIDPAEFGYLLISSGLVLNENIKWISFHGGYDFTYLLKVMICEPLPPEEADYFDLLHTFFPCLYDIKYLVRSCKNLNGGLKDIVESLGLTRVGQQHQAGSDSYVTGLVFFKLLQVYFDGCIDTNKYQGVLYGLNVPQQNTTSRLMMQ